VTGEQAAITITGRARDVAAGGAARPVRIDLAADRLTIALDGSAPVAAAYRDVTTIAADQGRVLVVLGPGSTRLIVEQLGASLGTLIGEVRERRAREQLHDRFIELPPDERLDLAEYRIGDEHGVAQLAYHGWGFGLLPVDERRPWRLVRRADIDAVEADPASGRVVVRERRRSGAEAPPPIELLGLGADVERHRARLAGLRDGALSDAAAIVARLMPDAPFEQRQRAGTRLVDGRAASAADLGDAWPQAEAAVLGDPIYAAAYRALLARGAPGDAPLSWLALAPPQPGHPDEHMAWFFVGLPGNLLAFELVSVVADAT